MAKIRGFIVSNAEAGRVATGLGPYINLKVGMVGTGFSPYINQAKS
jgi:hypothetical protein